MPATASCMKCSNERTFHCLRRTRTSTSFGTPTFEDDQMGFLSDLKSFFNFNGPSTAERPLPDSLIPIEKGDTPAPVGEDLLDLEAVELSGSGSDSSSEESDVDMAEAQPRAMLTLTAPARSQSRVKAQRKAKPWMTSPKRGQTTSNGTH
jgi:hypothetical protein